MKFKLLIILFFSAALTSYSQAVMVLKSSGKVVIGDTSQISTPGDYNLYVQHGVLTERVKVSLKSTSEWSDSAFNNTPDLSQVAESINKSNHLVDMPSASDLVKNGYELKSMDASLLQQIEWLWQHMIRMENENKVLQEEIKILKNSLLIKKD